MKTAFVSLVLAAMAGFVVGCGGDDDCEVVCAKNAECHVEAPAKDKCVSLCENLSEDEAYADGIAEQADCYDDETCESIASGACDPDYS